MSMRNGQDSIACRSSSRGHVLVVLVAAAGTWGCERRTTSAPPAARPENRAEALLADVVDPWTWARARGASQREQAIEDIGPYERAQPGDPASPLVNTNAHYWTALVGIAWDRDVSLKFEEEPVDLDGDGRADTRVTRRIEAKGGVLANPALFGLTPTPDDPRGRIGRISASTGVLGLREALRPDGTPSGEIGMTCWLCHGGTARDGKTIVLGLPGIRFDYGLLLATAAVLDDDGESAAYRRARRFPPGRAVRARLLLAGPGRQDLTGEFGLDVTVPGYRSARYPGTARVRQGTRGLVNPISVPGVLAAPGLALENWSGSEDAAAPWLERLSVLAGKGEAETLATFGLPAGDRAAARRALLFDLRNLGTLGLQDDSFPGLLWADAIYGHVHLSASATAAIPSMYAATAVRRALADEKTAPRAAFKAAADEDPGVARGREIFAERIVGLIANRQILKRAPRPYAAAKLEGPILAPIDPTRPLEAKLAVRCADCHLASPLEAVRPLAENPPPLGRCTHCHLTHQADADALALDARPDAGVLLAQAARATPVAIAALPIGKSAAAEVAFCAACHDRHRDFGPIVYSSSRLFPFDANGDGDAQRDPDADRGAGGIGTDPFLAFDVPRGQWPFSLEIPLVSDPGRPGRVSRARTGASWVRSAPLLGIASTAPYLHNGSVPTLATLLEPAARRPKTFPLGQAGFVLDTRLPGNGNQGHEFGTTLTAREKADLIAFLERL